MVALSSSGQDDPPRPRGPDATTGPRDPRRRRADPRCPTSSAETRCRASACACGNDGPGSPACSRGAGQPRSGARSRGRARPHFAPGASREAGRGGRYRSSSCAVTDGTGGCGSYRARSCSVLRGPRPGWGATRRDPAVRGELLGLVEPLCLWDWVGDRPFSGKGWFREKADPGWQGLVAAGPGGEVGWRHTAPGRWLRGRFSLSLARVESEGGREGHGDPAESIGAVGQQVVAG